MLYYKLPNIESVLFMCYYYMKCEAIKCIEAIDWQN